MAAKAEKGISDVLAKGKEVMFETLDTVSVDDIKMNGVTLRMGGKAFKLSIVEETPLDVVTEIREEFRGLLNNMNGRVREAINTKLAEMEAIVNATKREYESKELDLKRRLERSQIMPAITSDLQKRGLSVAPGNNKDELVWFYRGIYWPKFVDRKPIEARYAKKLITTIVIQIITEREHVKSVSTMTPVGLNYFSHYHQNRPDCWGQWHWKTSWKEAGDILAIAKEAEGVLENINTASVANRTPTGLPTIQMLQRHVAGGTPTSEIDEASAPARSGVTPRVFTTDEDSWST